MEKHTIGKFIAVLRKAKGMTQKELADYLFVSDKTVSRWEREESTPDINLLPVIAELFNVSIEELIVGQKRTSEVQADSTKSIKQVRYLIQKRWNWYSFLSLISFLLILLGFVRIVAMSRMGMNELYYIFLKIYPVLLIACVFQKTISGFGRVLVEEDGMSNLIIRKHNMKVKKIEYIVYVISLFLFVFSIASDNTFYIDFKYSIEGFFSEIIYVYSHVIGLFFCGILAIVLFYVYHTHLLPKWVNDESLYIDESKLRPIDTSFYKKVVVVVSMIIGVVLAHYIYTFVTVPAYLKYEEYLQNMFKNHMNIISIVPYIGFCLLLIKNRKLNIHK